MTARVSRHYLPDPTLDTAVRALTGQLMALGSLTHRYRDNPDAADALRRDEDALGAVLGILLGEQRARRIEDTEAAR